jgi:hypothetical protein
VIDVLAFPPTATVLRRARELELSRAEQLEARGRLARFISVGMFVSWIADLAAALAPEAGQSALVFGVGSMLLAIVVIAAHLVANRTLARASGIRRRVMRDYAVVRVVEAQPLMSGGGDDAVVAQYLRMVGRQQRPLCHVELAALTTWLATPSH